MIESNANEEAIDKWTAKCDEKLEKMEQPMEDIAKKSKDSRKADKRDETGASRIKQNKRER